MSIIEQIRNEIERMKNDPVHLHTYDELLRFIDTLEVQPDTFQNGNSRWKPTDAEIDALKHAIDACEDEWGYEDTELRSLLSDLNKL